MSETVWVKLFSQKKQGGKKLSRKDAITLTNLVNPGWGSDGGDEEKAVDVGKNTENSMGKRLVLH